MRMPGIKARITGSMSPHFPAASYTVAAGIDLSISTASALMVIAMILNVVWHFCYDLTSSRFIEFADRAASWFGGVGSVGSLETVTLGCVLHGGQELMLDGNKNVRMHSSYDGISENDD